MSLTSYRGYRVVERSAPERLNLARQEDASHLVPVTTDAGWFELYDVSDRFVGRFSSQVQAVNTVDLFLEGGK